VKLIDFGYAFGHCLSFILGMMFVLSVIGPWASKVNMPGREKGDCVTVTVDKSTDVYCKGQP
jgi:hypothetical protein